MNEENFKKLFKRIVDRYELAPNVVVEMLERILAILKNAEDSLSNLPKYEILTDAWNERKNDE